MKILHIACHFAEYALRLSAALAQSHAVTLVLRQGNLLQELQGIPASAIFDGTPAVLPDFRGWDPRSWTVPAAMVARLITQVRPDVIHLQEAPRDWMVAVWRTLSKYPIVLTVHDHLHHSGVQRVRRIEWYRAALRRRADHILVHGETLAGEFRCAEPGVRAGVTAVPHGPLGAGPYGGAATGDWCVHGLVLFFGRVEYYKGLDVLLDAMRRVRMELPEARLVVAGRGTQLSRLRSLLDEVGAEVRPEFIAPLEVPELFSRANIVVLPYRDATGSGVAAMALKYARPVIASRTGGLPEVVHDGVNGLLVEPGNSGQLAEAIVRVIKDQDLARRMSLGSLRLAKTECSWERAADLTTRAYEHAVEAYKVRRGGGGRGS